MIESVIAPLMASSCAFFALLRLFVYVLTVQRLLQLIYTTAAPRISEAGAGGGGKHS